MNISGILVTRKEIELLNEQKNITKELLKNLNVLNTFDWSKFKRDEFFEITGSLCSLFQKVNFPDSQEFVIFYTTDVTEMDAVTVFYSNEKSIFVDFEIKTGEKERLELILKEQLEKRKNEYIPQLFKDTNYLLIGSINNEINFGLISENDEPKWIDEKDILKILDGCTQYPSVSDFLYQVSNMASIVSIFDKIEDGTFKYFEDTKRVSEAFIKRLNERSDEKGIICYGNAGCGKSVLALKLFHELDNSKMLLLNPKLYFTLNMSKYYYSGKASYKPKDFIEELDENDIAIVDESQRLTEEQIIEIVDKASKVVFFGDEKQSFNENENLFTMKELANYINKKVGLKFHQKKLTHSKRYSDDVSEIIENLTVDNPKRVYKVNDYSVNVFCDLDAFLSKYQDIKGNKKMYVPSTVRRYGSFSIGGKIFNMAEFENNGFSTSQNIDPSYVGHTLHALSFDVDDAFVYLPTVKLVRSDRKNKLYWKEEVGDSKLVKKFMNELNILFSRGRHSLNIYVSDIRTYLFLKARLPK